ncbi:MAG: hypothetical protein ACO34E_11655 [Limisphaerales bacterium]
MRTVWKRCSRPELFGLMVLLGTAVVLGAGFWDGFEGDEVNAELWDVVLPYSNPPVSRAEVVGGRFISLRVPWICSCGRAQWW